MAGRFLIEAGVIFVTASFAALGVEVGSGKHLSPRALRVPPLSRAKVLFVGQGKGTALGWDLGILKAATELTTAFERNEVVLAANSGPSFPVAYFSCRGFSPEALASAQEMLRGFNPQLVNENGTEKLMRLMWKLPFMPDKSKQNMERLVTAFDHSAIQASLEKVLEHGTCRAQLPTVLVAANAEILDNRNNSASLTDIIRNHTDATDLKDIDYDRSLVLDPEGHPLGKPCTYFATPDLAEKLARIPWQQRACDIRPMRTPEDLRVGVLASVSEPTYFPWYAEPHPELITGLPKGAVPVTKRSYNGGFTNSAVATDLKRVLPQLVAIGSGRPQYGRMETGIVRGLYTIRLPKAVAASNWGLDIEVLPSPEVWKAWATPHPDVPAWVDEGVQLGYERARRCFLDEQCLPEPVQAPRREWTPIDGVADAPFVTGRGRAALEPLLRHEK